MRIELEIALTPEEMGPRSCGICGETFKAGSVLAEGFTDDSYYVGPLCRGCIEVLEDRNPEFVTVSELEQMQRDSPEPVFASLEEAERAELRGDGSYEEAVDSARLVRVSEWAN